MIDNIGGVILKDKQIKVITIKQLWASLIAEGYKEYEFRNWNTT